MKTTSTKVLLALASVSTLTACGWVDSTGRTDNVAPEILFDLETAPLDERDTLSVPIIDDTSITANFSELDSGKSVASSCGEWFSVEDAATSLEEACIDQDNCSVRFSTAENDPSTYLLTAPSVNKPFAVQYKIIAEDIDGEIDNHTFSMCIQAINDAPQTTFDTYSVDYLEGRSILGVDFDDACKLKGGIGVLDNDQDDHDYRGSAVATGNCISARLLTAPTAHNGDFRLSANGGFEYTPDGTLNPGQQDTFTYTAYDGDQDSKETRVTINIIGENNPPTANSNTAFNAVQGTRLSISADQLATDPEGLNLKTVGYSAPSHGVTGLDGGELYYESDFGYSGHDSFTATISDPAGETVNITVTLTVTAENIAPEISNLSDIIRTYIDTPSSVDSLNVDFRVTDVETENQTLNVSASSSAQSIVAVQQISALDGSGRGTIRLQPLRNGEATIRVTARDDGTIDLPAKTTTESFKVSISGMREAGSNNTRPRARNDRFDIKILQTRTFDVTTNDSDADGDTLRYRITDEGQLGNRATMSNDGQLTIDAPFIFGTAIYWVEYEADDGWGGVDSARARISVTW